MDLFEYQGKRYLARFSVPVAPGGVADTVEEAVDQAEALGYPVVVKAQVQVGGRGKAGGIKLADDADEAAACAEAILGLDIKGHVVRRLWVERAADIAVEHYVSFTLDRSTKTHLGLLSARGGVDIEQVAEDDPDAIARLPIDPVDGLSDEAITTWVDQAGLAPDAREGTIAIVAQLWRCYAEGDADLVEINPLVLTTDGQVRALDAKVTLDDNAAYRHPEWDELGLTGTQALDERERAARAKGLNYIGLDGTVGIIGNGAGLVMSTLDVVHQVGGSAANFLDVGGGASAAVLANALEVINADPRVRSILVNIFGGITRGDEVAKGVVEALDRVELRAPIVIRLDGTNATEGRQILARHAASGSGQLVSQPTMLDAARKAVELAGAGGSGAEAGVAGAVREGSP